MDAHTLYRQGIQSIRDQKNVEQGRDLLVRSLKQDPSNDMAWLWLASTVSNREKRLEYIERALKINPDNPHARKLKKWLLAQSAESHAASTSKALELPASKVMIDSHQSPSPGDSISQADQERIIQLLEQADALSEQKNITAAIELWIDVLELQADHRVALRNAIGHLWRLERGDDAKALIYHAIDAGSTEPFVFTTAIDIAERQNDYLAIEKLRAHLLTLPKTTDEMIVSEAGHYLERLDFKKAQEILEDALEQHPDSAKILIKLGDVHQEMENTAQAILYYDQATQYKLNPDDVKAADQKLARYVPVLTDHERGNIRFALREALGIGLLFLFIGWQDAGLNLWHMGAQRWLGLCLGLLGSYGLVTATSSPQQHPVATLLGGIVPAKPELILNKPSRALQGPTQLPIISRADRYLLGGASAVLLVIALAMVFQQTLGLMT